MSRRVSIRFTNEDEALTGVHEYEVDRPSRYFLDQIRERLISRGVDCTETYERSFYGWELHATLHGRRFQIVMQVGEEWYVDIEQYGLFKWLTGRRPHDECLDLIGVYVLERAQSETSGVADARIAG